MSDNISRQAVLNYPIRLDRYDAEHGNRDFVLGIESVMDYVESLPSAEPKTGRWIEVVDADSMTMTGEPYVCGAYCSECGERFGCESNFCPFCGADMRGGEE